MDVNILRHFWDHPVLRTITLAQLTTHVRLAAQLKREIQLPQPLDANDSDCAPNILPQAIAVFLSKSIGVPHKYMEYFWDSLKDHVWASPSTPATPEDLALFKEHRWELGLSPFTGIYIMDRGCTNPLLAFFSLYPPSECCTNPHCPQQGKVLKKEQQCRAVIYTLGNGVQPGWSVHLYCQGSYIAYLCRSSFANLHCLRL
jgi:hypothetical protein